MNITFLPLTESYFPLMLKWLESPHVKKWWDQDITYTINLVKEKYESYVRGYNEVNGSNKPIHAYIINVEQTPIGYIQIYDAYDFPRIKSLSGLSETLGAFDIFIGEERYLGQNLGSQAISKFLSLYGSNYYHILADPDRDNIAAIKSYERSGFKKLLEQQDSGEMWMLYALEEKVFAGEACYE